MTHHYHVTSVGVNPARDRAYRMRMYFTAMALRVACIVSLFWVRGFWIILVAAGAIVLPYFAVLIANAVSHVGGQTPDAPTPLAVTGGVTQTESQVQSTESRPTIIVDAPAERRASHAGESAETRPETPA